MFKELKFRFATESNVPWFVKINQKFTIIRTDVLVGNKTGIDFWKTVGFQEYCITLELENP